jgi:hypothetical protein
MLKRTTEKAREVQKEEMENENHSDLGKLILEGKKGWYFWTNYLTRGSQLPINYTLLYFGSVFYLCIPLILAFNFKDIPRMLFFLFLPIPVCFMAYAVYLVRKNDLEYLNSELKIYTNSISIGKKRKQIIFFSEVKNVTYLPFDTNKSGSFVFYLKNNATFSINLRIWSNENDMEALLRQQLGEKLK